MKLSVVILNYNVRYFLELCIKSVMTATASIEAEIIVVDNNSSDESCEMMKNHFPDIILVENKENYGFSKGNNIGIKQAKGEYLCILNPDTVIAEDTFIKMLTYAEKNPRMGILGCQLIDGCGQFLPESKRNLPTPATSIKKILGISNPYYANRLNADEVGSVAILVGAFMFLKKEIFLEVGGFDEDYFMYGEDIDLSYKVLKAGYENTYYGKTAIIHFKGESTLKDKTYAKRFYGAMQIFYNKHFKANPFFDFVIWTGITFSRLFHHTSEHQKKEIKFYKLITRNTQFKSKFPLAYQQSDNLENIANGTQIIFDGNSFSYSEMISEMKKLKSIGDVTFRILPSGSQFLIGSDSSQQRGEVVLLGEHK